MKMFLILILALLYGCVNPVKRALQADITVTISCINSPIDSIRITLYQDGEVLRNNIIRGVVADTVAVIPSVPVADNYNISLLVYNGGAIAFQGRENFNVNNSSSLYINIKLSPELISGGDCWNSLLQCDTINGKYRLSWNSFADTSFFRQARMTYWLVMDTVMIPEDINIGLKNRITTLYFDNMTTPYVESPIGMESRAYFRLFLFSETFFLYLKDCQTVLFRTRNGT